MAVAAVGAPSELAGHQLDDRASFVQFGPYRVGKDVGNGDDRILWRFNTVGLVLCVVRLVQFFNPVGLLVDERVDFLRMNGVT